MSNFKLLEDLVKINTIKDKNNKEFIDYMSSLLEKLGFVNEIVSDEEGNSCLIAKSKEKCSLCFWGHSDTVTFSEGWNTDPFVLTEKDGNLYGLGACDMKGGIAAFIEAIQSVDLKKLDFGIMVIITYDEEIGFKGVNLIKDRKDIPNNVIICEPTDLDPVVFCKGCMEYKVLLKGKAVHSSKMIKGDNAILKTMNFIGDLNELFDKLKCERNEIFDIPFTTMNIATINGGNSINIVPDRCELAFDFRTIKSSQHKLIKEEVKKICKKYKAEYELINDVEPCSNNNKEMLKKIEGFTCKKITSDNFVTEGNFLKNRDIIIIGPGPVTAHEANEHISIDSYKKVVEVYKNIINSVIK